ncbi:hypothetical protein ACWT_6050 [Actinoplanes sp. SE50]|uniref:hypothetical protein n=1 Tax=unclassified Actinoplanes TaxID=2626549 RepID=UPI00023EC865|nr:MULTISPECIES: hypothetical protein [unclassified Actinoplanes]AEV87067.1 hypothetical protein ACPL_6182 [Actinoplanes sp. SE50/110]ATO85465.1 hypothetical protein ACWT_6050 [Actinoplanes sp. SE50]SLM02877.1 hypothetical protein ACSP50_6162 [Actinoplanes sp. SE50/110]
MASNQPDRDPVRTARPVTPAELRDLAARAEQLGADIEEALSRLTAAGDEAVHRSGIRLHYATKWARRAGAGLHAAAGEVARIRGRSACPHDTGVCPDHGATLRGADGVSWCGHQGCGRRWSYSRQSLPCTEPVMFLVGTPDGAEQPTCVGHARAARLQLCEVKILPLRIR